MKTCILLITVALTAGQQIQQRREINAAVRLAGPGFFRQGGSFSSNSAISNNDQVHESSRFSSTNNFQNQGVQVQSNTFSDSRSYQLPESFQNTNNFQQTQFTNNRDQSQRHNIQENRETNFASGTLQQSNENQFQSARLSGNTQQQINSNEAQFQNQKQRNFLSQFQTSGQDSTGSRLTPINVHLTPSNQFLGTSNQQDARITFQTLSDQQNRDIRFQQTNKNQQNRDRHFQQSSVSHQSRDAHFQQSNINQQDRENLFQQSSANQQNRASRFQQPNLNEQRFESNIKSNSNSRFISASHSQSNNLLRSFSDASPDDVTDAIQGVFEPLNLPSGASLLLGSISTSFSCVDRPYGYYADEENSCRVFHICNPALFSDGEIQTYQYSFMCGEGTVFDQSELTCKNQLDATSCQEASYHYIRNAEFGHQDEKSN